MLYIYAFYSVELPKWKTHSPKQVKFIMERAFHKYLDKDRIPRLEPVRFDDLAPDFQERTYRLTLILLHLKN